MTSNKSVLMKKLAKKNLYIYDIYFFSFFFALGTFLPWFPIYMREVALLPREQIGIILSFSPLIAIVFQPIWGIINDKFHLDKKIVFMSLIMMNVFIVLILMNMTFYFIAMLFMLYGLFGCGIGPIQDSLTVIYTRKYGFKYGDVRIYGSIGYALASLVSGYTVKEFGYVSIQILATIFFFIALVAFMKIKQVRTEFSLKHIKKKSKLLKVLKNKVYIIFLLFASLSIGVISAIGNYTTLRINALGGTTSEIGLVISLTVIIEIVTMLYVIKVNNSISDFKLLVLSIFIQIPFLLVYVFSNDKNLLLYILLIRGVSSGLFIPVMITFISSLLPADELSPGLVLYSTLAINLTGYIMTILAGFIASWFSYQILFLIILILVLISLVFAYILNRMRSQIVVKIDKNRKYLTFFKKLVK